MKITRTVEIQTPPETVWEIVGTAFAEIGVWATRIPSSRAIRPSPDAPLTGRACAVALPGVDSVEETLLTRDDATILDAKRTAIKDAGAVSGGRAGLIGGDPTRVSREQVDLWLDGLEAAREHPERLAGTATAFASVIKAMFITQRPTNEALDSLRVPVLLLWGRDDHVVDDASLMQHARRPRWTPRPIDDVGHLLPVEAPDLYAQAVGEWLADPS